jgi:hypothetical protein
MAATVFTSVFGSGGATSRYGDFVVVKMSNCSFITTPMEFQQMSTWARGRISSGVPHRDRTAFVERFETVLARSGSGIATKGNRSLLSRIVKSMKANSMMLQEWSIPRDLDAGVEIGKKPATVATPAAVARPAAALPLAVASLVAVVMPLAVDPLLKVPA